MRSSFFKRVPVLTERGQRADPASSLCEASPPRPRPIFAAPAFGLLVGPPFLAFGSFQVGSWHSGWVGSGWRRDWGGRGWASHSGWGGPGWRSARAVAWRGPGWGQGRGNWERALGAGREFVGWPRAAHRVDAAGTAEADMEGAGHGWGGGAATIERPGRISSNS